jgi:hypothetical protein
MKIRKEKAERKNEYRNEGRNELKSSRLNSDKKALSTVP